MPNQKDIEKMYDRISEGARPDGVIDGRPAWYDSNKNILVVDKRDNLRIDKIINRINKEFK